MLLAIELKPGTILANQPEPTGQAGAFGASQFDPFADLLDGETEDHSRHSICSSPAMASGWLAMD